MIDYTRAAVEKTLGDFRRFGFIFNIVIELLSISYLIYAVAAGAGFIYANIPLLALSVGYLTFYIALGLDKDKKKLVVSAKQGYKFFKIAVHTLNLGITVYGIYIATEELSFVSIVLAAITTVGWALNLLITFSVNYLSAKANFIVRAIEADIEEAKRPVEKVTNFIKKVRGEEIEEKPAPDKTRIALDKTVLEFRKRKKAEKEQRAAERRRKAAEKISGKIYEEIIIEPNEKVNK